MTSWLCRTGPTELTRREIAFHILAFFCDVTVSLNFEEMVDVLFASTRSTIFLSSRSVKLTAQLLFVAISAKMTSNWRFQT
jgi:hypothetical protein